MKRGTHGISQEIGGVGTRGFVSVSDKSIGGPSPVVFVPRTLGRTLGTRPVSRRYVESEKETADPSLSPGLGPESVVDEMGGYVALGGVDVFRDVTRETPDNG
jgi:hypothetical protein